MVTEIAAVLFDAIVAGSFGKGRPARPVEQSHARRATATS